MVQTLPANAQDMGSIPGLERFHLLQLLSPCILEPVLCNKRSHHNEKPAHHS